MTSPTATAEIERRAWRCFHCDEVFETVESALEHFGPDELCSPGCTIDIAEYRRMEAVHQEHLSETDDASKQFYGMQADHRQALIREEEKGYARGMEDARKELLAALRAAEAERDAALAALAPFANAARNFTFAIGPDGIDDGVTVICVPVPRREYEVTLSTSDFSRAALQPTSAKEGK